MKKLKVDINVENRLPVLSRLLENGDYNTLFRESCTLLEEILRKAYNAVFTEITFAEKKRLMSIEERHGKSGVCNFGLGQLVGLYRDANFIKSLEKVLSIDLSLLSAYDMGYITKVRNDLQHITYEVNISHHEAKLIYDYVMTWLAYLGYANIESDINAKILKKKEKNKEDIERKNEGDNIIKRKKRKSSSYSPSYKNEEMRLQFQAKNTYPYDQKVIKLIIDENKEKENKELVVLDLGCASGHVTNSRFSDDIFTKVIGIDIDGDKINKANDTFSDKFSFYQVDLESTDFINEVQDIMKENNIQKFDVVFSALTIHHLKRPKKMIRKLRKFMNQDSVIVLRGSDDGSKIGYIDQGIINRIIDMTISVEGVSDRFNGRKLFNQLVSSGFKNVEVYYSTNDTVNMSFDERMNLFVVSFSYRKDYFKKRLDKDPTNEKYIKEYEQVFDMLEELEDMFADPKFYYCEIVSVAIGRY